MWLKIQRESKKYHDFFPEGKVGYTLAEAIREKRDTVNLKDISRKTIYVVLSFVLGGVTQWFGELVKITGEDPGEDPMKFPNGLKDLNWAQELLEGGPFYAGGSILGLLLARYYATRDGRAITRFEEAQAIIGGAFVGQALITMFGGLAHELVGRPDFPTMEIIQKVLGN